MNKMHDPSIQNKILLALKELKPYSMKKNQKVRIGNDWDGGYVLPSCALECDTVVSIGVGPDVSFDFALAEKYNAKIFQFDHTVNGTPLEHKNFRFLKKGWGVDTVGDFVSLDFINQLVENQSSSNRCLLKFDIEGGEYDVFQHIEPEQLIHYEVITFEIHDLEKLIDSSFYDKYMKMFSVLSKNHKNIHLHANNYQSPILAEGVVIPKVVELTFLRNDKDVFLSYSSDPIPGFLDRPNNPFLPDLVLNIF